MDRVAYSRVLGAAVLCYAALGAVLRILPNHVGTDLGGGSFAIGLAVGAPAMTGVLARPFGGRLADRRGPAPVVLAGAGIMAAGAAPAWIDAVAAQVASRLLVGVGEGMMMAAAVLWLLRLSGPEREGRALGHIGLANYAGLALGPLLAQALAGERHVDRVLVGAVVLPVIGAAVALRVRRPPPPREDRREAAARDLVRATAPPGVGLMLVNVGYVALLSFGTAALNARAVAGAALVVPAFAATVIAARTAGGSIPDRAGPRRTLAICAPLEAAGLAGVAAAAATLPAVVAVVAMAAGQALAVPALGLLALERVPAARQGAAAGLFFSWFDAGVGLGGPAAGLLAHLGGPSGALLGAAAAVALVTGLAISPGRLSDG
jgi:MFS family permease